MVHIKIIILPCTHLDGNVWVARLECVCEFGLQVPIKREDQSQEGRTLHEVSVYSKLRHLQGRYIPRMVAHG